MYAYASKQYIKRLIQVPLDQMEETQYQTLRKQE